MSTPYYQNRLNHVSEFVFVKHTHRIDCHMLEAIKMLRVLTLGMHTM